MADFFRSLAQAFSPSEKKSGYRPSGRGGWFPVIREPYSGAWQQNIEYRHDSILANHAVFACQTLIASDVSKLSLGLVRKDENGIWIETTSPAFSPVLRKPNQYQTRIQFIESWMHSKLSNGNTYVLKERDGRGVVVKLHILNPDRVRPLVSESGAIFYELSTDCLANLPDQITAPAREIIHDRFNTLFHPLCGLPPLFANYVAALQGNAIQASSASFFENGSMPGGILLAPGHISDDTAKELKEYWDANFTGKKRGKIAVLGDGLKYEQMAVKAVDAQLVEQLKWSAEVVCSTYHVPGFMIGVGQEPSYNNVQNLTLRYYSQCLQKLIEDAEACLDDGLGMDGISMGVEFDLRDLMRMDTVTQYEVAQKGKGIQTLNEQRKTLNLPPVDGGSTIYMQQQDHSLEAIAARDEQLIEGADDDIQEPPQEMPLDNEARSMLLAGYLRKELIDA